MSSSITVNTDSDAHPFKSYTFAFASDDDPISTDSGPLQLQIYGRNRRLTSKTNVSSGVEAIVEELRQQIGVLAELPGMPLIYSGRFKAYKCRKLLVTCIANSSIAKQVQLVLSLQASMSVRTTSRLTPVMKAVNGVKPWCGQYQLESIGKYWLSLFRPIRFAYYHSISLHTISTLEGNGPPSKNTDTEIHNKNPPGVQKHAFNSVYTQSQGGRPASVHLASAQNLSPSDLRKQVSGDTRESMEIFNRPDAC